MPIRYCELGIAAENSQKTAPKKWARGPPGRGVLRFWRRAYRRPVHFSTKIAIFSKNLQI